MIPAVDLVQPLFKFEKEYVRFTGNLIDIQKEVYREHLKLT